jgi:hypothetical protein
MLGCRRMLTSRRLFATCVNTASTRGDPKIGGAVPEVVDVSVRANQRAAAATVAAGQGVIRNDWQKTEIADIYRSPLLELIYAAVSRMRLDRHERRWVSCGRCADVLLGDRT